MFWDIFVELCAEKNTKPNPVAKRIGISSGAVTKWKKEHSTPNSVTLRKLADYFAVSTDYLLGNTTVRSNDFDFPNEELTLMEVIGSVKAGYNGIAREEYTGDIVPIPSSFFKGNRQEDYFLLRVSGNSMYPKMLDGDLVLVKRENRVDSGSIAVVLYDNEEATIKTVKYSENVQQIELIPANPEYETKYIKNIEIDDFHVLGRVVKLIRDL